MRHERLREVFRCFIKEAEESQMTKEARDNLYQVPHWAPPGPGKMEADGGTD